MYIKTKEEFTTVLKSELQKRNPDWRIQITHVPKMNGVTLTGLLVLPNKSNITPTIYLESFYADYEAGCSLDGILDRIELLYEEHNVDEVYFDMEQFLDFKNVQGRLCLKVINAERNKDLLQMIPHRMFHDLAIVYYVLLPNEEWMHGLASILVNNIIMDSWECTENEMYEIAYKNTREKFKYGIYSIQDVIKEIACEQPDELSEFEVDELCHKELMYYASNDVKLNGASILLYNDLLVKFAKEHEDFYILPSSVDEVLFVPAAAVDFDGSSLCAMVEEVNATCLETEKFLSNSVYLFCAETKALEIVTE